MERVNAMLAKCRWSFYEYSNKCSTFLEHALRTQQAWTFIPELLDETQQKVNTNEEITGSDITNCSITFPALVLPPLTPPGWRPSRRIYKTWDFLAPQALTLPPLRLLSTEKFALALSHTQSGKVPGPNGYSLLYYRTFWTLFTSHFYITVIAKEGKNPLHCQDYRPISLLNTDLKLFTKILALRLIESIPGLIQYDQVGFVPTREGCDNTKL